MAVTEQPETRCCDECGSSYLASSSQMTHLRPECSHWLYGNPPCVHEFAVRPRVRRASTSSPCVHEFAGGRCSRCGWDGGIR